MNDYFGIIIFCLYFIIQFFFTQRIYSRNYFIAAIFFSLVIPTVSFFITDDTKYWLRQVLPLTLLISIYVILLIAVKLGYKKINTFLIKKTMIKKEYQGKDFTYVQWDGDVPSIPSWWDEKLASKPSWFDYFITYSLLFFPMLLLIPLSKWLGN